MILGLGSANTLRSLHSLCSFTPASTTRGFGVEEMSTVAHWICDILDHMDDQDQLDKVREQVIDLCGRFPVYRSD